MKAQINFKHVAPLDTSAYPFRAVFRGLKSHMLTIYMSYKVLVNIALLNSEGSGEPVQMHILPRSFAPCKGLHK